MLNGGLVYKMRGGWSIGWVMARMMLTIACCPVLGIGLSVALLLAACGDQHEPRAAPIVARPLGGDSIALGAVAKVCTPEDEACVPTEAVACQEIWAGDPAEKPEMPPLSPREQAWCLGEGSTGSAAR